MSMACSVLSDSDQARYALTLLYGFTEAVAWGFRSRHEDVNISWRYDLTEMDIEAVGEAQRFASGHIRFDVLIVDLGLLLIWDQHMDDIARLSGFFNGHWGQAVFFDSIKSLAALSQADDDLEACVSEILSLSVALAAVTNDGNGLPL